MVKIGGLANEIAGALQTYTDEITEGLEEIKKEEAKLTVKDIRSNIDSQGIKRTGAYRKGWGVKKVNTAHIVHNRTNYQVTHLLEKGHAKVSGGRVRSYVHIEPAEKAMEGRYTKKVEELIKG